MFAWEEQFLLPLAVYMALTIGVSMSFKYEKLTFLQALLKHLLPFADDIPNGSHVISDHGPFESPKTVSNSHSKFGPWPKTSG